jgi:hypothetical protein
VSGRWFHKPWMPDFLVIAPLMEACLVATESHSERADPVGGLAKLLTSLVTVAHQPQSNGSPNRTG